MDVGQGPPRIQGLHGHSNDVRGAWNALKFVVQTGPQGRPGFTSSSTKETRGPVPTDLIGRLRGEAPPRCFSPVQRNVSTTLRHREAEFREVGEGCLLGETQAPGKRQV